MPKKRKVDSNNRINLRRNHHRYMLAINWLREHRPDVYAAITVRADILYPHPMRRELMEEVTESLKTLPI